MPSYLQAERPLSVTTPLGADELLLIGVEGHEGISTLFRYEFDLLAENGTDVAFDKLLGQKATAAIKFGTGESRYLSGFVSRIGQGARDQTFTSYRMEVVPQFWFLTRRRQSRIFQYVSVPDILKQVLGGLDVIYAMQGEYQPREYCVQYRESDFEFASRLMEEEGIFYFFEHTSGGHLMVLADTPQSHPNCDPNTVIYEELVGGNRPDERIYQWQKTQELRSGKVTHWDANFELPGKHLDANKPIVETIQSGTVTHKFKLAGNDKLELYDFPGGYANRFDGVSRGGGDQPAELQKIFQDNQRTVAIRMQEETVPGLEIRGASSCPQLTAGYRFTLDRHFDGDGVYVLTRVQLSAKLEGEYRSSEAHVQINYQNSFVCIPLALPFRPPRVTHIPRVYGTQTAEVVGPAGEEIFTDKYGRIKVQFFWDREGTNDGDSSCWVRVATPWAGKQWGMIHIPRIGQEVLVDFVDGSVDHPIVVGSVYNAEQMPPYQLPDNKTQSGIKSRSSLQGTSDNFNEIRFEDKKGSEEVYVHAEKDQNNVVENDETTKVGHDRTETVGNDETILIKHDRTETVENDETITVKNDRTETVNHNETITIKNDRTETVNHNETILINNDRTESVNNNETITIKANRAVTITQGNESLSIKSGNSSTKLDMGASTTEAMQSIELKVGQSSIKIDQQGVTIKGMMIDIEGQIQVQVKGVMTQVSGDAMLTLKGGITMIN